MDRKCRDSLPPHLARALAEIARILERAGIPWLLAGSAMRALRGYALRPADLDLEVGEADAAAAARALGLPAPRRTGRAVTSLRAQGRRLGVEVDLSAAVAIAGPPGLPADFAAQRARADEVACGGWRIPLAPLEEALARARAAGDGRRERRLLAGAPADLVVDVDWIARRARR